MASVTNTKTVIHTKDSEVTVNLNLTITIDEVGGINVGVNALPIKEQDKVNLEVPDFDIAELKQFGKKV